MKALHAAILLLISFLSFSQDIGLEFRAYPAGQMFLLSGEKTLNARSSLLIDLGYNRADRKDFGVQDKEEGGGFGGGIGYRYFIKNEQKGFFVGLEHFVWQLAIDWRDTVSGFATIVGSSEILVLQPAFNGGYKYVAKSGKYFGEVGLAFGREYNVKTQGAEVGQGGISMLTIAFGVRL